eukprot:m.192431 g.192431  ORF g.192431 m.192431 type:complete len:1006 (-) comp16962_c0_seq2:1886-4903(-)
MSRLVLLASALTICNGYAHTSHIHHANPLDIVTRKAVLELQRYLYTLTGEYTSINNVDQASPASDVHFLLATEATYAKQRQYLTSVPLPGSNINQHLVHRDSHVLHVATANTTAYVLLYAANPTGIHHAVFSFLERCGLRFRIAEDVVPDQLRHRFSVLSLVQHVESTSDWPVTLTPRMSERGLQPFHDFSAGPDWWNQQEYNFVFEQMAKMKMNFLGLHTYPIPAAPGFANTNVSLVCGMYSGPEPNVWVGLKGDFDATTGNVSAAYPSTYFTTAGFSGTGQPDFKTGGVPMNTSKFRYGAGQLYQQDLFGSEIQMNLNLDPATGIPTSNSQAKFFNDVGRMFNSSFSYARNILGHHIAIGTEVPLSTPPVDEAVLLPLTTYYSSSRQDHFTTATACAECEGLYEAIRVEGFVMSVATADATVPLSTCYNGITNTLVIGRKTCLPDEGTLVRVEGYAYTTANSNRTQVLQLWSNKHDRWTLANSTSAAEAKAQGYTLLNMSSVYVSSAGPGGNLGQEYYEAIFKRIMAAYPIDYYWLWTPEGWEWNRVPLNSSIVAEATADLKAAAAAAKAVGTPFSLATSGWVLGPLGDRAYLDSVLSEEYAALSSINMFLGWIAPDAAYTQVKRDKWAIPWMEDDGALGEPEFWVGRTLNHGYQAGIVGADGLMGIHWRTQEVSLQISALAQLPWVITLENTGTLTAFDVYYELASVDFGLSELSAFKVAKLLSDQDSFNGMHQRPFHGQDSDPRMRGNGGCSGFSPNPSAIGLNLSLYFTYIDELTSFRDEVARVGLNSLARFDYWLNLHQLERQQAFAGQTWAEFEAALSSKSATAAASTRITLINQTISLLQHLSNTITTVGSLGTMSDFQQRGLPYMFDQYDTKLMALLKVSELPASMLLPTGYTGSPRLFVMSPRTSIMRSELSLEITAMAMLSSVNQRVELHVRSVSTNGVGAWSNTSMPALTSDRNVYRQHLSVPTGNTFEYYVSCGTLLWPAAGSNAPYSVIVV